MNRLQLEVVAMCLLSSHSRWSTMVPIAPVTTNDKPRTQPKNDVISNHGSVPTANTSCCRL
jgi:hypothetical protein